MYGPYIALVSKLQNAGKYMRFDKAEWDEVTFLHSLFKLPIETENLGAFIPKYLQYKSHFELFAQIISFSGCTYRPSFKEVLAFFEETSLEDFLNKSFQYRWHFDIDMNYKYHSLLQRMVETY